MLGSFARFARGVDADDRDGLYLLTCLVLAVAGGFADAGSYVLVGSFTGHITGNTLLAAIGFVRQDWMQVLACVVAVASFVAGTALGTAWPHAESGDRLGKLLGPLLTEAALVLLGLAASRVAGLSQPLVFLACVCLALGLQNGTLNRFGPVSVHSTYITGMSTALITALVRGKPDARRSVLALVVAAFVLGALLGAYLVLRAGVLGFVALLGLLAPAIALAALARRGA